MCRPPQRFLADHFDTFENKIDPDERTLCGHIDLSRRGDLPGVPAYGTAGAVQSKAADAAMGKAMTLTAALGHSCGIGFNAAEHLRKHPEFAWQRPDFARHAFAAVDHVSERAIEPAWRQSVHVTRPFVAQPPLCRIGHVIFHSARRSACLYSGASRFSRMESAGRRC